MRRQSIGVVRVAAVGVGAMNLRCDSTEFTQDNTRATADDLVPAYVSPLQAAPLFAPEATSLQRNGPNRVVGANWYP